MALGVLLGLRGMSVSLLPSGCISSACDVKLSSRRLQGGGAHSGAGGVRLEDDGPSLRPRFKANVFSGLNGKQSCWAAWLMRKRKRYSSPLRGPWGDVLKKVGNQRAGGTGGQSPR
ncbi:hypothetical protein EYF80_028279 [Liparis tanakae]|uniref:Secreted protein n=1 Tax=Liparis tanakae TaxID=230148 RepID=A0A4Z2H9I9_9TELE|nr:hypothetical protein EYF80_028279 [Liparis tanakae]